MMPDLGKYADAVLWSYAASIALIALLVIVTLLEGRRVRAEMKRAEDERNG